MIQVRVSLLLVALLVLAACGGGISDPSELPEGDVNRGRQLFMESIDGLPSCVECHALSQQDGTGPGLAGYGDMAAERVEGQSAFEYTYHAIVNPADYLTPGFRNLMYQQYGSRLSAQQIADLIAYLLSL